MIKNKELLDIQQELLRKLWYIKFTDIKHDIDKGKITIVDQIPTNHKKGNFMIKEDFKILKNNLRELKGLYSKKELDSIDNFELGVLFGKIMAFDFVKSNTWLSSDEIDRCLVIEDE